MGLSSVKEWVPGRANARRSPEESRGRLAWLGPRSGHPDGRRTTLAEDPTCREAAYLNKPFHPDAGPRSLRSFGPPQVNASVRRTPQLGTRIGPASRRSTMGISWRPTRHE